MKEISTKRLKETAKIALLAGGDIIRRGFLKKRGVEYKTPTSPVTKTDRASERKIIGLIRKHFPDHTFLAEESAFLKKGDLTLSRPGRYRWVIDPLDGTVNFVHGIPQSCVSIAVECDGRVLAGGVYDPFRDELFLAERGKGATLNGKKISVSPRATLAHAMVVTGFPYDRRKFPKPLLALIEPFFNKGIDIRRFGAAALDLAWIACGRADVYWEFKLCPWDVAAGWLLVEEAGGRLTNFRGQPLTIDAPAQTLATNGRLHSKILSIFRGRLSDIDKVR